MNFVNRELRSTSQWGDLHCQLTGKIHLIIKLAWRAPPQAIIKCANGEPWNTPADMIHHPGQYQYSDSRISKQSGLYSGFLIRKWRLTGDSKIIMSTISHQLRPKSYNWQSAHRAGDAKLRVLIKLAISHAHTELWGITNYQFIFIKPQ